MAPIKDDDRPTEEPAAPEPLAPREPPFQALFPNLDRVSRSAFRAGTVSRRRIGRATGLLIGVAVIIAALIGVSVIL
ncbi:hypothetical protein [Cryobacterium sp. W22_MBD10_FK3]|uniref:hypothetical protein n=1 Tax=Cryobacterium sp. W22_MBD10_FK3 TaxID=3240273 RepID=UPI003F920B3C